jgi:hypothetical protein
MKLRWRQPGSVDHEVIWGSMGLLAVLGAALLPVTRALARVGYVCPFRRATGIPCPSCGTTRAFVAAASLQFGAALRTSPLATVFFLGLVAYVPYALGSVLLRTRRLRVTSLRRREKRALVAAGVALVLANWVYLILSGAA